MTILDATIIDDPVTRDEQLALAVYYGQPGDRLVEHKRGCPADRDPLAKCYCVPLTLTLGAEA